MKRNTFLAFVLLSSLIFAQDGNLDTNFGTNGYVAFNTTDIGIYNDCLQPDAKLSTDKTILFNDLIKMVVQIHPLEILAALVSLIQEFTDMVYYIQIQTIK